MRKRTASEASATTQRQKTHRAAGREQRHDERTKKQKHAVARVAGGRPGGESVGAGLTSGSVTITIAATWPLKADKG